MFKCVCPQHGHHRYLDTAGKRQSCSLSLFGFFSLRTFCLRETATSQIDGRNSEAVCVRSAVPTAPGVSAQIRSFSLRLKLRPGVPESRRRAAPPQSPQIADAMSAGSTWLPLSRSPWGPQRTRAHAAARRSGRRRRAGAWTPSWGRGVIAECSRPGRGQARAARRRRREPLGAEGDGMGRRGGSRTDRSGRGYSLSQDSRLSPSASAILQPPGPAPRPQNSREPVRDEPGRGLHGALR